MKRYAAIVISLLAVVGLVTGVSGRIRRGQAMQVRFNKRDLPKHDVHIITSADPTFDVTASAYFKAESGKSNENLKPFSVFVKNSGNRTVVAYMLIWQMVKTNGQVITNKSSYAEPGMLMGDEMPTDPRFKHTQAIEPNQVRCFSWSAPINAEGQGLLGSGDSPSQNVKTNEDLAAAIRSQLTTELSQATDVTVSLDGIFFDDGTFVGPDTSGYFEQMQAMVNAKLDLLRQVATAKENGKEDQAFEAVTAKSLEPDSTITSESSPEEYYRYYMKLFAREIHGMKSFYGKQRLVPYLLKLHKRTHPVLKKIAEER